VGQIKEYLHTFNWSEAMVLAHNTMFDGAILNWHFGISPRVYTDTLCIGRAIHGVEHSVSLKALAERYNLGAKGDEVLNTLGKRREQFTDEELERFGDYCVNDVELTYKLFMKMAKGFPKKELKLIDTTLRMFVEPVLRLDLQLLEEHLTVTRQRNTGSTNIRNVVSMSLSSFFGNPLAIFINSLYVNSTSLTQ
jgi:DNA polymerase